MVVICKDWASARSVGGWPERACMCVFLNAWNISHFHSLLSFHLQVLHAHHRAWKQSLWSPLYIQNISVITSIPSSCPYLLGALFPCEFSKKTHRPWTTQLVPQNLKLSGPHSCSDYLAGFQVLITQANTKSMAESKAAIWESLWGELWAYKGSTPVDTRAMPPLPLTAGREVIKKTTQRSHRDLEEYPRCRNISDSARDV